MASPTRDPVELPLPFEGGHGHFAEQGFQGTAAEVAAESIAAAEAAVAEGAATECAAAAEGAAPGMTRCTAVAAANGVCLPADLRVGLVFDEAMTKHVNLDDDEHPEQPARITRIFELLQDSGLAQRCIRIPARPARKEELLLKHTVEHVETMLGVEALSEIEAMALGNEYRSVYLCPDSTKAALLSCGSVVDGVCSVASGAVHRAICIVRPPGHHAECDCAMGFCMFANVSVAVAEAQRRGLSHRTLIVDWDVHHGNGTQKLFEDDSAVLFFSIHRYDGGKFFPGGPLGYFTSHGTGEGEGFCVNVPWDARGAERKGHPAPGDAEYLEAFRKVLLPICEDFKPDLVVVSAGFDAAAGDPLGECEVTPRGYHAMTEMLCQLGNGRVVIVLEGGYNLDAISKSMVGCARALFGEHMPVDVEDEVSDECPRPPAHHFHAEMVERVRQHLRQFWPSLCLPGEEVGAPEVEIRVPAAALRGTFAEMDFALRERANSDEDYEKLKQRQEAVLFKLDERPPEPANVKSQLGWQTLRDSFKNASSGPPYLVVEVHVLTPEQTVRNVGLALQAGADAIMLLNSGHAHSPPEAALPIAGVQHASIKGVGGGAAAKAGKAQLDALAECFAAARDAYSDAWLGVSIPQLPASQVFKWVRIHCPSADAAWVHHLTYKVAEITWETPNDSTVVEDRLAIRLEKWFSDHQPSLKGVLRERQVANWKGIVFGSLASSGQDRVHHLQESEHMGDACRLLLRQWVCIGSSVCDVVATGSLRPDTPCAMAKLQAMGGVTPLALITSRCHEEEASSATGCVDVVVADGLAIAGRTDALEGALLDLDAEALRAFVDRWRKS